MGSQTDSQAPEPQKCVYEAFSAPQCQHYSLTAFAAPAWLLEPSDLTADHVQTGAGADDAQTRRSDARNMYSAVVTWRGVAGALARPRGHG